MKVCDAHVHFGLWRKKIGTSRREEHFYSPAEVIATLDASSVDCFASSCTSVQAEDADVGAVTNTYFDMCQRAGERCRPLLWVTDRMFEADPDLKNWLSADIPWAGLKLHNEESDWLGFDRLDRLLSIAAERQLVVQAHTGPNRSQAGSFGYYCEKFPEVRFLLAHARPVDEAMDLAHTLPNVWLDSAFVEDDALRKVADAGLAGRLLFGSDMPVYSHWYQGGYSSLVNDRVSAICRIFGDNADAVLHGNFKDLLG